jgi:hypothetical protein
MKYLKLFENFIDENSTEKYYPNVFNNQLVRGLKIDENDFIDDPSKRVVHLGDAHYDEGYREYMSNWAKFGIPDPTKSVHMFFRTKKDDATRFGKIYNIKPRIGSMFGYTKQITNGGLGHLYWIRPNNIDLDEYQTSLIKDGTVGKVGYDELVKMAQEDVDTLHVWTESPCLHTKIVKAAKEGAHKTEKLVTVDDLKNLGVDNPGKIMGDFFKRYANEMNQLRTLEYSKGREEALILLSDYVSGL